MTIPGPNGAIIHDHGKDMAVWKKNPTALGKWQPTLLIPIYPFPLRPANNSVAWLLSVLVDVQQRCR